MSLWTRSSPLVLASASATRRLMLESAGLPVEIRPADIDERAVEDAAGAAGPAQVAALLAAAKARTVAARSNADDLIVAADQTLGCDERVFHKPDGRDAARAQLLALRGRTHELHAAVAVHDRGRLAFAVTATARLTMRNFSTGFLDAYLDAVGSRASASVGGYQIEGIGIQLFERIDGDHFTILGLPLLPLLGYLRSAGHLAD